MWLGAWVCLLRTSRRLTRREWTVTYQWQYFTITSSISECDHKCETRNAQPEIGTDGSSQTLRNREVDGYRSRFGAPGVSGLGFWMGLELNQPIVVVQTRTADGLAGPVANTNDQNTGSELRSNSCLLPGCWENCGENGLWSNGNGSSAGIMWILTTCQPTKSLWSIPRSTRQCTEAILHNGCHLRSENVNVCEGQSGWTIGKRIPSFTSIKDS